MGPPNLEFTYIVKLDNITKEASGPVTVGTSTIYISANQKCWIDDGIFTRIKSLLQITLSETTISGYNALGGVVDICDLSDPSKDCGYLGITKEQCEARFCLDCGYLGIQQDECENRLNCCWDPKEDAIGISTLYNVVSEFDKHNIPLETIWNDLDYMEGFKDFTWNPINYPREEVAEFVNKLHENNQHYVVIVDPGIKIENGYWAYEEGVKRGIFIKNAKGENIVGQVWPGLTNFPDWFNKDTEKYWGDAIEKWLYNVDLDGNTRGPLPHDPENYQILNNILPFIFNNGSSLTTFSTLTANTSNLNEPPYRINNGAARLPLDSLTLSMDARHANGLLEYDVHNLYGHMEAMTTWKVWNERFGKGKRPFIITRSTFAGTGRYAGHWTESPQEPYIWPSVAATSRRYLRIRYSLLPYYYTLFYESHTNGSMVLRPLFVEFPHVKAALIVDKQFMLGGGILVSPVLSPLKVEVKGAYIPPGIWYNFYSHDISFEVYDNSGIHSDIYAPLNEMPIHLRGGHIIPMQRPRMTTAQSRKTNYYLTIPLDENASAKGTLYLDDGESLDVKDKYTYISYIAYKSTLIADVKWGDVDYNDNDINSSDGGLWVIDNMGKLTFFGLQLSMCSGWNLTWVLE
ncbi:6536_t:CDS:2 [Racocetra fulgida]|uniref:6536_t:CDS:1 n=1 Tax=Racocetra fulgida TaxID=60492 RepID=A0A9N8WG43_9GLOM|nr:6536_t:CDS:2 [Racocetra fulgida]